VFGLADFDIFRLAATAAMAVTSSFLIARYRFVGVVISVIVGWILLYFVYHTWHAPPSEWDEDKEDIAILAPILMAMWCLPFWGLVTWFKRGN
jgi:hypothetical protein